MKIQIRRGVFETNSSSVHTLTIAKGTTPEMYEKYKGNLIFISESHDFGWDNTIYSDLHIKLDYLVQAFSYATYIYGPKEDRKKNQEKSLEQTIKLREQLKETLSKLGIEITYDNNKVIWEGNYWAFVPEDFEGNIWQCNKGYIDHGDELSEFVQDLMEDEDLLIGFLFNPKSVIRTGNDNQDDENFLQLPNVETIYEYKKGN